ncbi:hypothetical protein, partial [Roseomonas mucosa]
DHDHELASALCAANAAAPHLRPLAELLIPRLPRGVLASSTIKGEGERASSRVVRLAEALGHRWISTNSDAWTNTITVDIEHARWRPRLAEFIAMGGPEPLEITASPWKGSAHITWLYDRPVRHADPEQARVAKGVKRGLVAFFEADPRFANRLRKNPWHRAKQLVTPDADLPCGDPELWEAYLAADTGLTYHTEIVSLRAVPLLDLLRPLMPWATERKLALLVPKPPKPDEARRPRIVVPGAVQGDAKGSRLFHASARAVRRACTGDATVIRGIVERTAAALRSPAAAGQISTVASNITRWMNEKWWGPLDGRPGTKPGVGRRSVDAGAMTGEAADAGPAALAEWRASTVREKRQAAGQRSRARVADQNDEDIRQALADLRAAGERITQATVAARSGVSLPTVKRRWNVLDAVPGGQAQKVSHGLIRPCAPRRGAAPPAQPGLPETNNSSCFLTPAMVARQARAAAKADKVACAAYAEQAARMLRPGAATEPVFPPQPGASPRLREAHAAALAAQATARRRAEDRRRRAQAAERARERAEWHAAHARDEVAWQARLAELASRRAAAVERALWDGGESERLERIELVFASVFAAEHRARGGALGQPVRSRTRSAPRRERGPDLIDMAIPW